MAKNSEELKAPECSHTDKWDVAGSLSANSDDGIIIITTLYCTGCGETKVKLNKVRVGK